MTRTSHESLALTKFREIASAYGYESESSQGAKNRVPIAGSVYYQFGDLRVDLPESTIVVEVESSGGVTNLAKYWECIDSGRLVKPLRLLHVYRQVSENDYSSHMVVWRFLCKKMQHEKPEWFEGVLATYQAGNLDSLSEACSIFEGWLREKAV